MFMTPKNILTKLGAVPVYSTSGVLALAGVLLIMPGGLLIMAALILCWAADWLTSMKDYDVIDTTIEEYEGNITGHASTMYGDIAPTRSPDEVWSAFYGEGDDPDEEN